MKRDLLKVAIRENALFVSCETNEYENMPINETTSVLLVNCSKLGFSFSEELLKAINSISPKEKMEVFEVIKEITGVNKNWTPLVKQWDKPTGETLVDHVVTLFANVFKSNRGSRLACGHFIPTNTFPLDRYNGCPFCGTPFEFDALEYSPSSNKLKVLELWNEEKQRAYFIDLLESPVVLDATQTESLKALVAYNGVPKDVKIAIKETLMLVIDALVEQGEPEKAGVLFSTPGDILRYLWYAHTGFLQVIEPKTIIKRMKMNLTVWPPNADKNTQKLSMHVDALKLKFTRSECKMYANWLNGLTLSIEKQCEIMHPKRNIWIRVIRALRLAEYSKRDGYENLLCLLDKFYNKDYVVWQGKVETSRLKYNADLAFRLLKQRPGLFARSLFSNMLWFGAETAIKHFKEIVDQVPLRLVFTLSMYAELYFDETASRSVRPLGGTSKRISANKMLGLYSKEDLQNMQRLIRRVAEDMIRDKFANEETKATKMFIDKGLFNIPLAIGDRSETVQDLPSALMGTKYSVVGDTVRLFLQWGQGLKAQHLDMDLSCRVSYDMRSEFCSYSQLTIPGCKHSGDIQSIPNEVGTAEYIDIDLSYLSQLGARYVTFTCNAYTSGSLSPNLVVGWMNSNSPMKVSPSGVAYNPADVQHQIRVTNTISKGIVFGVLNVETKEITWLEMSFSGQVTQNLDLKGTESLLRRLNSKLKIGDVLTVKAEAQGLEITNDVDLADEVFDLKWASNTAAVSSYILGS